MLYKPSQPERHPSSLLQRTDQPTLVLEARAPSPRAPSPSLSPIGGEGGSYQAERP
jgi:hypothetical protein